MSDTNSSIMEKVKNFDDEDLRKILTKSYLISKEKNHEYVTVDHFFLSFFGYDIFDKFLESNIGKEGYNKFKSELEKHIDKNNSKSFVQKKTSSLVNLLEKYISIQLENNRKQFQIFDMLSLILKTRSYSSFIMKKYGIDEQKIKEFENTMQKFKDDLNNLKKKERIKSKDLIKYYDFINQYCVDLTDLAENKKLDRLIGREKELSKVIKTLCRRNKNNVIMVGKPGVGKTAIVEGLAIKIAEGKVPEEIKNSRIYSLNVISLIAGTKYRGELEERIHQLSESIKKITENSDEIIILFVDEIHSLIGLGNENRGLDIANLLKPSLLKGNMKLIGATTDTEYKLYVERDSAFKRRFQKIFVEEPSEEESIKIIKGLIHYYESAHGVKYTDEAIECAVKFSKMYINDNFLPDKALDVIDYAGSRNKLRENRLDIIGKEQILEEISEISNVPISSMKLNEKYCRENLENKLKNLAKNLKSVIFGQDQQIDEIVSSIIVSKSGLNRADKPECAFLINGPTGVGKTELCKQIAKLLDMNFVRLDMSEFMEEHSVSKILGSPPGYVGYREGATFLLDNIEKYPNTLILFDEIEKAHQKVFNIFLQILDYGKLTTSKGKTVSFNNCMIFFTGNIGSSLVGKRKIGFLGEYEQEDIQNEKVKELLSPEFRNRLDGIITFNSLSKESCIKIIWKFINELNCNLSQKKIRIDLDNNIIEYLLEKGFDPVMGARPLQRVIDSEIKKLLAAEILFGKLKEGGNVLLTVSENKINYIVEENVNCEEKKL